MIYDVNGNAISIDEPKRYRILQYNISNFTGDGTFDGYAGDDLEGYVAQWAKFIGGCGADICLFEESREYIDSSNTIKAKNGLYDYLYNYTSEYGITSIPWQVAILTNIEQNNVIKKKFNSQISGGGSKYIAEEITLNGIDIFLIVTHFVHGGSANTTIRQQQMQELVNLSANYSNVIIGGDFNTQDITETSVLTNAGFTLGNGGIFGEQLTQPKPSPTYPVDNVCVRGNKLRIQSFETLRDCTLSDHYPTVADIIVG